MSHLLPDEYLDIHVAEEPTPSAKPKSNDELFDLLVRIRRLQIKVRGFVSMARVVGPLQRQVYDKLGPNKGRFILDVKVRLLH